MNMVPIQPDEVSKRLRGWEGRQIYIHLEVNPGAYWRNGQATLVQGHVRGTSSCRVFLELDEQVGLIQVDQLTHMLLEEDLLICTGYDDHDRIARTIEVSSKPFSM